MPGTSSPPPKHNNMTALVAAIVPLIPSILKLGASGINFINDLRTTAKQSGEWTPEAETSFLESLLAYGQKTAWKTDAELKN